MAGYEVFNGKIAIVTGAASGLGQGFATEIAKAGGTVVAADVNLEGVTKSVDAIVAAGGVAEAHELDVRSSEAVTALVEGTVAKFGRLDYIFNNAGIAVQGPAEEIPIEDWDEIIDINLKGVVYGTSAAYKQMVKQRHGHIVNTASLAGLVPSPLLAPYSTVKFGVVGLTESLRVEAKSRGVKVTALCPGFIESGIYRSARYSGGLSEEIGRGSIPLMVPLDKGVAILLKGVANEKHIVTLPFYGHLFWRGYRFVPAVGIWISGKLAAKQRKAAAKAN